MEDTSLEQVQEIKDALKEEKVLYSGTAYKKNRFGFKQERSLIVTDKAVYNIKKRRSKKWQYNIIVVQRRLEIERIKGITVSKTSDQFVVHGSEGEYDYLLISPQKATIVEKIETAYEDLTQNELLFTIINFAGFRPWIYIPNCPRERLKRRRYEFSKYCRSSFVRTPR